MFVNMVFGNVGFYSNDFFVVIGVLNEGKWDGVVVLIGIVIGFCIGKGICFRFGFCLNGFGILVDMSIDVGIV